ncbi:MAG: hypothetical protein AB8B85_16850 [Paracoccaceae bacterium]
MSKRPRAFAPAKYETADINAVQALYRGNAEPQQQQRAIEWILTHACQIKEVSYRPDGDGGYGDTAFAEGRRFVGLQIMKMVTAPAKLKS